MKLALNPPQMDCLKSKAQYVALVAGTGVGKTYAGIAFLLNEISRNPRAKHFVLAPKFKTMKQATLPTWLEMVEQTPWKGEFKQGPYEYHLPAGGKIFFRSVDDPDAVQGLHIDGCIIMDEAGLMSTRVWHNALQRTNMHRGRIFIGTTPYTTSRWLKTEFQTNWLSGDKDYYLRQAKSIENPLYPKDKYYQRKRELPDWKFRMLYDGDLNAGGSMGLVYPDLQSIVCEVPATGFPKGDYWGGIDWGGGNQTSDPFSSLVGVVDEDDCLWLAWERYVKNSDILDNGAALKQLDQQLTKTLGYGVSRWWADASRPDSIRTLRQRAGLTVRKASNAPGSIATGIDEVTARIRTGRLKILKTANGAVAPGLLRESELYRYALDDEEEAFGNVPIDRHNHSCDALRYLCMGLARKSQPSLA